jgi:hypothetical protein
VTRRRGGTTAGLVEGSLRAVERVARCGVVPLVGVDGGLDSGEPRCDGRGRSGVLASCGEMVERGNDQAFGCGELSGACPWAMAVS